MKFLDEAKIYLRSGNGGDGCTSFRREKYIEYGGPDGGDGGNGGDIIFKCVNNRNTLIDFRYQQHFKAARGNNGSGKKKKGQKGKPLIIEVPIGTSILSEDKSIKLLELHETQKEYTFLKGGNGGFGNYRFKSSKNITPIKSNPGHPGKELWVRLRLNLIADIGIVGLPNVGKSSFLKKITNAKPKIGDYPFTTLYPNLGVINYNNFKEIVIADIPGIIENAHKGTGLGIKFLGHIEKCKLILHFLDINDNNIIQNYKVIRNELEKYGHDLDKKKELVVLTKKDLSKESSISKKKKLIENFLKKKAYCTSINDLTSIEKIKQLLLFIKPSQANLKKNKWSP